MKSVTKEVFLYFSLSLVVWYNRLKIQLFCLLAEILVIQLRFMIHMFHIS